MMMLTAVTSPDAQVPPPDGDGQNLKIAGIASAREDTSRPTWIIRRTVSRSLILGSACRSSGMRIE